MQRVGASRGVLALVLGVAGACASDPASVTTPEDLIRRGEITWGADLQGGEPYLYEDPANPGRIIGFEVEIMDAIAAQLGVRQRMVQYNWSNLVPSLERGDFDVAFNGLEATAERRDRIALSDPYFVYAETLAVRRDSPYRSLQDLRGKRVGTLNQTYAHDLLRAAPVEVVLYEGNEEPYTDLEAGRVDAVLLDNIIADRYGCGRPQVRCLPEDVARGAYIVGVRKQDKALLAAIDAALARLRATGELRRILQRNGLWDHRQDEPWPVIAAADASSSKPRGLDAHQWRLFVSAAGVTLLISVLAFALSVPLGAALALMRLYGGPAVRGSARVYIEAFRGTPALLQLFVLYYGLAPYVHLSALQAAIIGLGLNYAAYEAEVYRAAMLGIARGQTDAAKALGLGPAQILWHVLAPQALRASLPAMTNDFVSLLKDSSLVSVITVIELTKRMTIAAVEQRSYLVPGLACAALYLALSVPLSELARRLERRLGHDLHPQSL